MTSVWTQKKAGRYWNGQVGLNEMLNFVQSLVFAILDLIDHICKNENKDLFPLGSVKHINLQQQHYSDLAERNATFFPPAGRDDIIGRGQRMMSL